MRRAQARLLVQLAHELAREHDLLELAGVDAAHGLGDGGLVCLGRHRSGGECHARHVPLRRGLGEGTLARGIRAAPSPSPASASSSMRVTHARPSRRPSTSSGTTSTLVAADPSANAIAPNATRPLPGRPTRSSTSAAAATARQARAASSMRVAPDVSMRSASPMPMMPSPRRIQSSGCRGSSPRDQRRSLVDGIGAHAQSRGSGGGVGACRGIRPGRGIRPRRGIRVGHWISLRPGAVSDAPTAPRCDAPAGLDTGFALLDRRAGAGRSRYGLRPTRPAGMRRLV